MERKAFLKTLGAGAAFALTFSCLHGCSSDSGDNEIEGEVVEEPTGIDFTIDLNSAEAVNLTNNGGFILKDLVVIVKNLEGEFVAASQICSHEGYDQVRFASPDNVGIFYCDVHGSRFAQDGTPLNSTSEGRPLKIYSTEVLADDMLRIFEA
ncbi:ubiquinol-cytochrome c reductase iron-sulfur subunit [Cellulophaga sp. Z1A5H]|uniref:QcrA and Rieske domain-containing protein n=1 Tax=Cellulophaga sp. Z1A5H TaxID=2687291 RepID=UPI0013FD8B6E|nr:Rieske 2Fe-2S domain-containing protein [Cellulophaga sp. Z1A5H]